MSLERAFQFSVDPPQNDFSLSGECIQLRVLIEFDRGDRLIFGRALRNLILDSVPSVHEDLACAIERRTRLLWIVWDRSVAGYEDISVQRAHRIKRLNPRGTVAARHVREF